MRPLPRATSIVTFIVWITSFLLDLLWSLLGERGESVARAKSSVVRHMEKSAIMPVSYLFPSRRAVGRVLCALIYARFVSR